MDIRDKNESVKSLIQSYGDYPSLELDYTTLTDEIKAVIVWIRGYNDLILSLQKELIRLHESIDSLDAAEAFVNKLKNHVADILDDIPELLFASIDKEYVAIRDINASNTDNS
jgi:hypothetical protein